MTGQHYDVAIIGGGIVGLATAMELSSRYPRRRVVVVEKEPGLAAHQTGHNSGVIHSGLYYRPGSQKARFCVEGAEALRAFCDQNGIRYEVTGKIVVATTQEELPALQALYQRGLANRVPGLELIGPERLREMEPHASGLQALVSPSTGIVDYTEVAHAYARRAEAQGVELFTSAKVMRIAQSQGAIHLETTRGDVQARRLINCAGLYADAIARMTGSPPGVRIIPFRGEYYTLAPERRHLVRGLIYPVPNPQFPFLGVHFTRMIHGDVEAGPNAVLALAQEGYRKRDVNAGELWGTLAYRGFWAMASRYWKTGMQEYYRSFSKRAFARALQRLVPEVQERDLAPAGAGVRAQAVDRKGNLLDDFYIVETPNAIHVLNAPSPAATASLAIGRHVAQRAGEVFGLTA